MKAAQALAKKLEEEHKNQPITEDGVEKETPKEETVSDFWIHSNWFYFYFLEKKSENIY